MLPIIHVSALIAFIGTAIFVFFRVKKDIKKTLLFTLIFLTCIIIPSAFTSQYYDFGWDSTTFHELSIISLSNGQNPIYNNNGVYLNETAEYYTGSSQYLNDWIESHFIRESKAFHIIAASLFGVTHNLQSSKSITIIGMLMSFFLFFAFLMCIYGKINPIYLALISLTASLNATVICSSLSFYVDGFLFSSLLSLMALFGLFFILKEKHLLYIALLYSILFINIKSTAILFFFLLIVGVAFYYYRYNKSLIVDNMRIIVPIIILFVLCSYHPYIHNMFEYHDISGGALSEANNFDDIPQSWKNLTTPHKFILSLFSYADVNPIALENSVIKIPILSIEDAIIYSNDPPKVGGWGPLFSGIILISGLLFLYQVFRIITEKNVLPDSKIFLIYFGVIIVTILVFQLSWYARYVPQVALLPVFMALPYLNMETKPEKMVRLCIFVLLLANILLVGNSYYGVQKQFSDFQNEVFTTVREKMGNELYLEYEGNISGSSFIHSYLYELYNQNITAKINSPGMDKDRIVEVPPIIYRDFKVFALKSN